MLIKRSLVLSCFWCLKAAAPPGGPLPEGADAVVQIENTEQLPPEARGRQRIRIVKAGLPELSQSLPGWSTADTGTELGMPGAQAAKGPGDDVRAIGSDIKAGEVVLHRGDRLGAAEIGLLATVGATDLQVCSGLPVGPL